MQYSAKVLDYLGLISVMSIAEHKAMDSFAKESFTCEEDAKKALKKFHKSLNLTQIKTSMNTTPIYQPGPRKQDTLPTKFKYSFDCTSISSSLEHYQDDLHSGSCFILASNDLSKTPQEIIDAYKNRHPS